MASVCSSGHDAGTVAPMSSPLTGPLGLLQVPYSESGYVTALKNCQPSQVSADNDLRSLPLQHLSHLCDCLRLSWRRTTNHI